MRRTQLPLWCHDEFLIQLLIWQFEFATVLLKQDKASRRPLCREGRKGGHMCVYSYMPVSFRALWQSVGVCACQKYMEERGESVVQTDRHKWTKVRNSGWPAQLKYQAFCMCMCEYLDVCVCVWVFQTGSLSLQQDIHTQQAGMREREELRRAIEQSDRLLSRVRELEEQNSQLNKEKNEVATKYRAVSLLLCSAASLSLLLLLFSCFFL